MQPHNTYGEGSISLGGYRRYGHTEEHILIAEKALGKKLPQGAVIHHVDGRRGHNVNSNLVICPNQSYHALLHRRQEAYEACGNANARKCRYCCLWGDPIKDDMYTSSGSTHHRRCRNQIERESRTKVRRIAKCA